MNEHLNNAISKVAAGKSYNQYLGSILNGEVKTLSDFVDFVNSNFWSSIWGHCTDPMGTMDEMIQDLANASAGKKSLSEIDADMEEFFGGDCNVIDDFADSLREEIHCVMTAVKYLIHQQAQKPSAS